MKTNMNYSYIKEEGKTQESKPYTAFSVVAMEGAACIYSVKEAFLDEKQAQRFVSLCNDLSLDPIHLLDAVYDAIVINETE